MANFLVQLTQGITPKPVIVPEQYDGVEYAWSVFVFRPDFLKSALRLEALLLLAVLALVGLAYWGRTSNDRAAHAFFAALHPLLAPQFSHAPPATPTAASSSEYLAFYSGRKGVRALYAHAALVPRSNPLAWAGRALWTLYDLNYAVRDEVEVDMELTGLGAGGGHDFVWAVAQKEELKSIREERWDLTFTKTTENAALPPTLSVLNEYAEITEHITKLPAFALLLTALASPATARLFLSLSVSDQPRVRPDVPVPPSERSRHLVLSLVLPGPEQAQAALPLVQAALALADQLPRVTLRPETRVKLRRTREELDREIKEEAEREEKEEAAEKKREAKAEKERERVAALSPAEQKKELERDRKRAVKKGQGKVSMRK